MRIAYIGNAVAVEVLARAAQEVTEVHLRIRVAVCQPPRLASVRYGVTVAIGGGGDCQLASVSRSVGWSRLIPPPEVVQ